LGAQTTHSAPRPSQDPKPPRRAGRAGGSERGELPDAAPLFAALGDATRLRIVERLCAGGPLPIVRLTDATAVSRQAVTKHLLALERVGLVRSDRAGRERIWALETRRIADVEQYLRQISTHWDGAIERLRRFVEQAT
jgi:DNA-binding transcriptional ArsR family regulator